MGAHVLRVQNWNRRSCCSSHTSIAKEPLFTQQTNDQVVTSPQSVHSPQAQALPSWCLCCSQRWRCPCVRRACAPLPGAAPTAAPAARRWPHHPQDANPAGKHQLSSTCLRPLNENKQVSNILPIHPVIFPPFHFYKWFHRRDVELVLSLEVEQFCYRVEPGQDLKNPRNVLLLCSHTGLGYIWRVFWGFFVGWGGELEVDDAFTK